ncbi:MAG: glycosyltransferase family 2 protein [Dechloromonas sp.]|uniref:glycosyltransferase family 2 protein n=1 Tax=Azonexaceae TaxID=2008795 RepID=UPI001CF9263B|nr:MULTISPECIES: glycosyltransferase family 2 protein [Azonexaceae]MBT9519583.1 glycosyltransferase family 2 protein [Dechloromonas sp.]UCV24544.1 glycosyltransferase family 2 protein [Ferribacterium limneticum]
MQETFYWLAGISLLLALHPFVTYPLSLYALRLLRRVPVTSGATPGPGIAPSFAICVCAYNEEAVIAAKIANLLALREQEPDLEILVHVDAASDRTAEILSAYADRITLQVSAERRGKTAGMNSLVARSTASIIVFTDANVMLDAQALPALHRHFADPGVGCVCGNLIYVNSEDSVTAATGSLYWRFEEAIKRLEGATGSVMGADGSLFAIRRHLHHPPPEHIIDDMYVSFRILCDGYRIIQASDVRAYEKSATSAAEEFSRKQRIACQAFNVHRLLWPRLRRLDGVTLYKYLSHKLLRWLCIYLLVLAFASFELALVLAGQAAVAGALAGLAGLGLAIGYRFPLKPFAQIFDILSVLAAVGLGVWRSLRGERFQTWTPAASVRQPLPQEGVER